MSAPERPRISRLAPGLLLACLVVTSCSEKRVLPAPASPQDGRSCPEGYATAPDRSAAIWELLGSTEAGRSLVARSAGAGPLCFSTPLVPAVTTEGVFLLSVNASDAEMAARLGHLLLHGLQSRPEGTGPNLEDEVEAHALELELRRALGVRQPHLKIPFEAAYWEREVGERKELLRERLKRTSRQAPSVPRPRSR